MTNIGSGVDPNDTDNTCSVTINDTDTEALLGAVENAVEAIIFPNPSGRYLEVRSPVGGNFKILSLSGKPSMESTMNTRVDISSLQSGLYLMQLPDGWLLNFSRKGQRKPLKILLIFVIFKH
ncbi:MAG: T9SS type A sorting domain-containing protein [Ekhidna sp.]|nr:T9SS type A sorting domain-containing protein [Ekhidna sp.]